LQQPRSLSVSEEDDRYPLQRNEPRTILDLPSRGGAPANRDRLQRRRSRGLKADLGRSLSLKEGDAADAANMLNEAPLSRRAGQIVPSIASLVANPSSASEVPVERIPALVAELASEQSALSALQGALTVGLLVSQANAATRPELSDRLMTAVEGATALGVTQRWVQRRARRLPFARRISDHAIRYSEAGLKRWMSNRKLSAA
jgi:hypothetical protein